MKYKKTIKLFGKDEDVDIEILKIDYDFSKEKGSVLTEITVNGYSYKKEKIDIIDTDDKHLYKQVEKFIKKSNLL